MDSETKLPLPLTHIKFTGLNGDEKGKIKWEVSNENGIGLMPFQGKSQIEVSYVGYEKYKDTIFPNMEKTIFLKPIAFGLSAMVVTAQFVPLEITESVYNLKTIQKEVIQEQGATNLREILNTQINFKTNNGHANETAINLNGLSGNHVKFMIDGVPIEGRLDGNIDLSQINLDDIEKIEVVEGPTSVAYGTNALGGVINIITKKKQYKKLALQLKSYFETVGQYNLSANFGLKKQRNLFKFSFGRNFFNGYSHEKGRFKDWKPREQYFGKFLYSRRIHHMRLSLITDGFHELMVSRGVPIGPYNVTAFDTYFNTGRWNNKVLFQGRIKKHNYLDITASQSFYKRTRNIYFKDLVTLNKQLTSSLSDQDTTVFNTYLFRTVYNRNADSAKVNFMVGTALKKDIIHADRVVYKTQTISDLSLFGNISYHPISKITLQPALRYAYNTKYHAPLTPSFNFLLNWNKNTDIRASYSEGFRTPSLKELFIEFHLNSSINLYGNDDLDAETSRHWNISIDRRYNKGLHHFRWNTKLYYSRIEHLIQLVRISPVNWKYQNLSNLTTIGGNLGINYEYKGLQLNNTIGYYGNRQGQFESEDVYPPQDFSMDITSQIRYSFKNPDWSILLNYKYTGEVNNYYFDDEKQIQKSRIGDYHTLDLTTTKIFLKKQLEITAGVKNLLDVTAVELVGDVIGVSSSNGATKLNVLWGRSFFVSVNYAIKK